MNVADRVNVGLLPSSESGWLTACAALRSDRGGVLHIHATVTSSRSKPALNSVRLENKSCETSEHRSVTDGDICASDCSRSRAASCDEISPSDSSSVSVTAAKKRMTKFAKTCAAKPAWCEWADITCQTLRHHLDGMLHCDWSVSVQHIEHVKSYAPHVDHVVADIDCRPKIAQD